MKKKLTIYFTLGLIMANFSGCGLSDIGSENDLTEYFTGDSAKPEFKVTQDAFADHIVITWSRTGKVKKYSYTQLEVRNSSGTYVIASTNTNQKYTITCTKSSYASKGLNYHCIQDNFGHHGAIFTLSETNIFQERGGTKEEDPIKVIGSIKLDL